MTYLYPTVVKAYKLLFSLSLLLFISQESFSQLVFKSPSVLQGDGKAVGSMFRFSNVTTNVDAIVTLDSLVNGATLQNIDLSGSGYNDAFQPQVKAGNIGTSYALFSITFVQHNTTTAMFLSSVTATNLDLDGTATLKEMCEIDMNGGSSKFMNNNPTILVSMLSTKFRAINLAGIDYGGIDTTASQVMFQVKNSNIASFKVRFGAVTISNSGSTSRQYSLYMKEFAIANATTLPVTLTNFQANLKDKSASLVWTTTNQINFSHFVIEKSTDGKNFQEAAVLFADEANTNAAIDYKYKDNLQNSSSKVVFYRLKMVDANEKYAYSETRMVRLATEVNTVQISTFPNPVTSEVRVLVPAEWQEKAVTYEIYNSTGILVQRVQNQKAAQVQQINVQNLNGGNYIVKVSNGSVTSTSKIIKIN